MLRSNLLKLVSNNCLIKAIPQINVIKYQQKYIGNINLYNISYSFSSLENLLLNNKDFVYNPSELFLKDIDRNNWLFNKEKELVWRPSLFIPNSIEIKLLNNNIYVNEIKEHPDIFRPVIIDDKNNNDLIEISFYDFKNKNLFK